MRTSPKKKNPRVKTSIAAQAGEAVLRASARRARQGTDAPFDLSVPSALRSRNLPRPEIRQKPAIRLMAEAELSPFVLRLAPPSPETLIAVDAETPVLLNFLDAEPLTALRPSSPGMDLSLEAGDVGGQIAEDAQAMPRAWRLPRLHIRRPTAEALPAPSDPVAEPLNVERLAPDHGPAALLASLDLPEMEDEEESEMVEFAGAEMRPSGPAGRTRRAWRWPKFSLPPVPSFGLPFGWERAVGAFVLLAFAFVLPLHAMTAVGGWQDARASAAAAGTDAVSQLSAGASAVASQNPAQASAAFARAAEQFQSAQSDIASLGGTVSLLVSALPRVGGALRAGTELADAGAALARAGARLSDGFSAIQNSLSSPTDRLGLLDDYIASALPWLDQARGDVQAVQFSDVPAAQRGAFQTLSAQLPPVTDGLKQFVSVSGALRQILGGDGQRTYLVVFQNSDELRPTGGFMGSFAELTVRDGRIVSLDIPGGGTYDVQGNLKTFTVSPPPLQLLAARWGFQDANWFPDFPTSARAMLSFYRDAGGPTVDGVIAVNADFVAGLLSVVGSIDMPEYGRTITSDNFVADTQQIVEREYDKTLNQPKAFIAALAPKLLDRVKNLPAGDFLQLLQRVHAGFEQRDIQAYFPDERLEKLAIRLGWDGGIKATGGDYLMPVDANLGGGKTDGVIQETVDVLSNIASDGTVIDTVAVTRIHRGTPGDPFTGANNVDYLRLYVPKGSQLLNASGFSPPDPNLFQPPEPDWSVYPDIAYDEQTQTKDPVSGTDIYQESGKTVFGNWVQVKPGSQATASFTYRLPFKVAVPPRGALDRLLRLATGLPDTARYTFTLQKQSGADHRTTRLQVNLPDSLRPLWADAPSTVVDFDPARDHVYAALLEAKN